MNPIDTATKTPTTAITPAAKFILIHLLILQTFHSYLTFP